MASTTHEVTLHFEATHAMPRLPRWHHEHDIHGHQYELGFVFTGPVPAGAGEQETALRQWADRLPGLTEVRVSETRDTSATYRAA
ncbi:hypothetical protein [Streptomyces sp. NPDC101455]|uniref:hypothetical protein n=1 Tax=Streptomyces sp. NPDC101455 TaxID=3366142 RepID=UPI003809FBB0